MFQLSTFSRANSKCSGNITEVKNIANEAHVIAKNIDQNVKQIKRKGAIKS